MSVCVCVCVRVRVCVRVCVCVCACVCVHALARAVFLSALSSIFFFSFCFVLFLLRLFDSCLFVCRGGDGVDGGGAGITNPTKNNVVQYTRQNKNIAL